MARRQQSAMKWLAGTVGVREGEGEDEGERSDGFGFSDRSPPERQGADYLEHTDLVSFPCREGVAADHGARWQRRDLRASCTSLS